MSFLLDGRVRHDQPAAGHRTGIEPVLLAASIPARAGARVLEGGAGSGAALLCLAHRVPGIIGLGLEIDPAIAAIASANATANRLETVAFLATDLATWRTEARFDGTLTIIIAAAHADAALAAIAAAGCGSLAMLPLWPRRGNAARLVLLRGVKGGRGPFRLLPGLVLHEQDGGFTAEAQVILRDGAALPL